MSTGRCHTPLLSLYIFYLVLFNRYYKGEVTTVLKDVSEFMENLLNDCLEEGHGTNSNSSPDADDMTFLVLRVLLD